MRQIHAEWIKKWADGEQLEWRNSAGYPWSILEAEPNWYNFAAYTQFRVKPEVLVYTRYATLVVVHGEPCIAVQGLCPYIGHNLQLTITDNKLTDAKFIK